MNEVAIIPYADIVRMAEAMAKSHLFGVNDANQVLSLMLIAQAEGLHPAIAARDYNVIQGKPALKAEAMLARFQQSGGRVEWQEMTDQRVVGTFSHTSGGSLTVDWDMNRAKKAGFGDKQNWTKFPRQMLRARVISEGVRAVYPAVTSGIYTPEEVEEFAPVRTVTPEAMVDHDQKVNEPSPRDIGFQIAEILSDPLFTDEDKKEYHNRFKALNGQPIDDYLYLKADVQDELARRKSEEPEALPFTVVKSVRDVVAQIIPLVNNLSKTEKPKYQARLDKLSGHPVEEYQELFTELQNLAEVY
jgi:hypothetical protein